VGSDSASIPLGGIRGVLGGVWGEVSREEKVGNNSTLQVRLVVHCAQGVEGSH